MSDLTEISTFGWYSTQNTELLASVSTFGWYFVSLEELVSFFKTLDFGLIVDRLHAMGIEIESEHFIGDLDINQMHDLGNLKMSQVFKLILKR